MTKMVAEARKGQTIRKTESVCAPEDHREEETLTLAMS